MVGINRIKKKDFELQKKNSKEFNVFSKITNSNRRGQFIIQYDCDLSYSEILSSVLSNLLNKK